MPYDRNTLSGNTTMLILKLLETEDMYGYQIIEELSKKSGHVFCLKTGTLYPILHGLEKNGMLHSFEKSSDNQRIRKYYKLTSKGKRLLYEKQSEWNKYFGAVNQILFGGEEYATS